MFLRRRAEEVLAEMKQGGAGWVPPRRVTCHSTGDRKSHAGIKNHSDKKASLSSQRESERTLTDHCVEHLGTR